MLDSDRRCRRSGSCRIYVFLVPELALWIPALGLIVTLVVLNLPNMRNFDEIESWFALIKIIAIVTLIIPGIVMLANNYTSPNGTTASVSHLWDKGGFFPTGFFGFVAGFQIAVFAFVGIELVGTAAAETENPERNLPKAINSIPVRIVLFYLGSLLVIMTMMPWNQVDPQSNPLMHCSFLVSSCFQVWCCFMQDRALLRLSRL